MAKAPLEAAVIADVTKVWTGKELFDVGNADLQAISTARGITFTTAADKRALVKGIIDAQIAAGVETAEQGKTDEDDAGDGSEDDTDEKDTIIADLQERLVALEDKVESILEGLEHGVKNLIHKVETLWNREVKGNTAVAAQAGVTPMANVQKDSGAAVVGAPVVTLDADGKPTVPNVNMSSTKSEAQLTKEHQEKTAALTGVAVDANTGQAATDATDKEAVVDTGDALTPSIPAEGLTANVVVPPQVAEGATTNTANTVAGGTQV